MTSKADHKYLFCYYHKTGTKMITNFAKILQTTSCKTGERNYLPMYDDILSSIHMISNNSVNMMRSPDALFTWSKFGRSAKIVHLVRDPVDLIVSGYLYHSQVPPPEKWLHEERHEMCRPIGSHRAFITALQKVPVARNLSSLVEKAHELCKDLTSKYHAHSTYGVLKNADGNYSDIYEGMRVEAVRSIFQGGRAEQLRMAANALWERTAPLGLSMRFFLSEFPAGNIGVFNESMSKMIDFLNGQSGEHDNNNSSQTMCIDKASTMERSVNYVYVPDTAVSAIKKNPRRAVHITGGFLSAEAKDYYKHKLLVDPVLGPLLRALRYVILDTTVGLESEQDPLSSVPL